MNDNIKNTYRFKATDGIENLIENWAKSSGFKETILPKQLDDNDITYCFSLDENGEKTLLTVNILDDIVYIETWVMASVDKNRMSMMSINALLNILNKGEDYGKH